MKFYVIGIGNKKADLSAELQMLVQKHSVFSGGARHFELVKHLLPKTYNWISIKSPLEQVFKQYEGSNESIVVFASGDPLFYGFSNTLRNRYSKAEIYTYPYFNSIQILATKTGLNSNELKTVSVHGRPWDALDEAIIKQGPLIGVLTDKEKSPAAIAERLIDFGYTNYSAFVGEDLEGEQENVQHFELEELKQNAFDVLNCVILKKKSQRSIPFGIDDEQFEGLAGRPNMITKMPVRLCSLHYLELATKKVLWDIGFCTGSLSIEAKLRFPYLNIYAFEMREECGQIMENNQRKFGTPGINSYITDFYKFNISELPKPDAVFIGGHGGRLTELLEKINDCLLPAASIVINAVQESSVDDFIKTSTALGWVLEEPLKLKVNSHNEIAIIKAVK